MWISKEDWQELKHHAKKCDQRDERNRQVDAEIIAELKQIGKTFTQHMEWEEKDRAISREEACAHTRVMESMVQRLGSIESEIASQPLKIKEASHDTKDDVLNYVRQTFATRTELNNAANSIRDQLRYVWYSVAACAATAAWVYSNLIR